MVAVKEGLTCQQCGNPLGDDKDGYGPRIVCLICFREHDENGQLIRHPVGKLQAVRAGVVCVGRGPKLPIRKKRR